MRYDRWIEIGTLTSPTDGWGMVDGGSDAAFVLLEATWATVTSEGGGESRQAAAIATKETVVFSIRYVPSVTIRHVVRYNGEVYNIVYIAEEGRRRVLHLKAEVRK